MLPDGLSIHLAHSPKASGTAANDKATGGDGKGQAGWDVVVQHSGIMDGLNLFGGMSTIDQNVDAGAATGQTGDRTQYGLGATYAVGSLTFGVQRTRDNHENTQVGTSFYENNAYGVSFNVNDDLSLSVGVHESERNLATGGTSVELEATSIQMAYSMGGASIKAARTDVDNASYATAVANDKNGYTLALTLAF